MNPPTYTFVIGVIAAVVTIGSLIALSIWATILYEKNKDDEYDSGMRLFLKWAGYVTTVIAVLAFTWGFYPYEWQYHSLTSFGGTVTEVDSRLVSAGEGMQTKHVVRFGGPQQYGVYDTRMATVKPGDNLQIDCVRVWQWGGSHGWDCYFESRNGNTD